jgi:hypothetical protein
MSTGTLTLNCTGLAVASASDVLYRKIKDKADPKIICDLFTVSKKAHDKFSHYIKD